MKFRVNNIAAKNRPRPVVKPFEVTFTVENSSDLGYLLAILSMDEGNIREVSEYPKAVPWTKPNFFDFWKELDDMMTDHIDELKTWQKTTELE